MDKKKGLFGLGIVATIIIIVLALVIGVPLCCIASIVILTLLGPVVGVVFSDITEQI